VTHDPNEIREDIEDTRARMGEKVDALGYKADVPTRTKEYVGEKKDAIVSKVRGATPDTGQVTQGVRQAGGIAKENPFGLAIGAAAAGFLAGLLLPSTRVEDERLGDVADQVKQQARETGQEVFERGKHVAEEAAQSASETARESGRQQQEELSESLRQRTQQETTSS
jgi:gas vesicle protein